MYTYFNEPCFDCGEDGIKQQMIDNTNKKDEFMSEFAYVQNKLDVAMIEAQQQRRDKAQNDPLTQAVGQLQ